MFAEACFSGHIHRSGTPLISCGFVGFPALFDQRLLEEEYFIFGGIHTILDFTQLRIYGFCGAFWK